MKGKHIEFVVGIAVGAALFGGGTAYAAGFWRSRPARPFMWTASKSSCRHTPSAATTM